MASKTKIWVDLEDLKKAETSVREKAGELRYLWDKEEGYLRELVEGARAGTSNFWEGKDADEYRQKLDEVFGDLEGDIKGLELYCDALGRAITAYTLLGEQIDAILGRQ
jgi:hypothetical protein